MNWGLILDAVRDSVIASVGLDDVQWRDRADAGAWREGTHVDLLLRSPTGLGVDEYRQEGDGDEILSTSVGNRRFGVSVMIETDSQESGETSPGYLASLLRTRLRRPSIASILTEAGVALVRIEASVEQDARRDDRMYSVSVTDVFFSAAENDADDSADTNAWIETVTVGAETLTGEDGNPTNEQPEFTGPP